MKLFYWALSLFLFTFFTFHIFTAYALPMFRQQRESSTKKQDERARRDPVKSHRPDLPVYGPGMYLNFNCMVEQKHISLFPIFVNT